jgi:hypothetical protein
VERLKLYRATLSVIRFMAVLNFIYTVLGTAFLVIGLFPNVSDALDVNYGQSTQFLRLGKCTFKTINLSIAKQFPTERSEYIILRMHL